MQQRCAGSFVGFTKRSDGKCIFRYNTKHSAQVGCDYLTEYFTKGVNILEGILLYQQHLNALGEEERAYWNSLYSPPYCNW